MGCQFTRLTRCCRQRLPFSVQTTGGFYGVSVSDTSGLPLPQPPVGSECRGRDAGRDTAVMAD